MGINNEARSWDLALSTYDNVSIDTDDFVDYIHHYKGGKWDGIYAFFANHPDLLESYEYFWLVDDDIQASASQVEELFSHVEKYQFEIAQPALTPDSYYAHRLTLQCPIFNHRHTNFVELMMPVLSRAVLKQVLPYFRNTQSGLGLDWLWNGFVSRPNETIAIIDRISMSHYRPRNKHLRGRMEKAGIFAHEEKEATIKNWKLNKIYPIAFSGMLLNGKCIRNRLAMSCLMTKNYWMLRRSICRPAWSLLGLINFSLRQAFSKL
ncbi:MAG: DUF707 domain-containing protein [Hydrogenophilaceae bacterium]|nr:DUF707 domain-containing protein [Hydrogenophilaceae bacterium]